VEDLSDRLIEDAMIALLRWATEEYWASASPAQWVAHRTELKTFLERLRHAADRGAFLPSSMFQFHQRCDFNLGAFSGQVDDWVPAYVVGNESGNYLIRRIAGDESRCVIRVDTCRYLRHVRTAPFYWYIREDLVEVCLTGTPFLNWIPGVVEYRDNSNNTYRVLVITADGGDDFHVTVTERRIRPRRSRDVFSDSPEAVDPMNDLVRRQFYVPPRSANAPNPNPSEPVERSGNA